MRSALSMLVASALLATAGPAAPQASAPAPSAESTPAKPPERPVLNLKLEEPVRGQPRITFGPRDGKTEQRPAADTLPALGGSPSTTYDRPFSPDERGSPFPKDSNPNMR
jgi:hypothetical protein